MKLTELVPKYFAQPTAEADVVQEVVRPMPIKGYLAVHDPEGVMDSVDGIYVFKLLDDATEYAKHLETAVAESDMYVLNEHDVDGHYVVFLADHRADLDELNLVGFGTDRAALEKRLEQELEAEMFYGLDNLDDVDFIRTNS